MSDEKGFKEKVLTTIQKYHLITAEDKVLVGVSGGPDSISLLHVLQELGVSLCVAHVNHGLRENANQEEAYVVHFCEERKIPCFVKKIRLKEQLHRYDVGRSGKERTICFFCRGDATRKLYQSGDGPQ